MPGKLWAAHVTFLLTASTPSLLGTRTAWPAPHTGSQSASISPQSCLAILTPLRWGYMEEPKGD